MEALSSPPEPRSRPIPLVIGSSIEWRSATTGEVVGLTGVAPRGRKGLWAAMAAATADTAERGDDTATMGDPPDDDVIDVDALEAAQAEKAAAETDAETDGADEADVVPLDEEAHLAFLARVAFTEGGDTLRARTPDTRSVAQVVDLDVFRARYGRRRS